MSVVKTAWRRIKHAFTGKSATTLDNWRDLAEFLGIGDVPKKALSEATYFACLKVLSESIGKMPLKLQKHVKDVGVVKMYDHPLYHIVGTRPNPYMTATHFWSTVEYNRNHYGNAYVWIQGAGTKTRLWVLPSNSVQVWIDDKGLWGAKNAIWYLLSTSEGIVKISHDSMLHFRTSSSFDGIMGKPVRDILQETIDGNLSAQQMLNRSYKSNFSGKAVLQYTGEMSPENEQAFAKRIEDFVNGKNGQKNIIPMMFGTQLVPINTKLADNEFLGLKKYSALQIAAAFGIKPNQINDYEKASYASAEAQQLAFYVDTLLYILKQYEEEITHKLLTEDEIKAGCYFKFNVSAILRADQKTQLESLRTAVQAGIYTPNEAREYLDKEGRAGGDRLLVNGNMIPVEMAGAAYTRGGERNEE